MHLMVSSLDHKLTNSSDPLGGLAVGLQRDMQTKPRHTLRGECHHHVISELLTCICHPRGETTFGLPFSWLSRCLYLWGVGKVLM